MIIGITEILLVILIIAFFIFTALTFRKILRLKRLTIKNTKKLKLI
jgi:hypothetical protein